MFVSPASTTLRQGTCDKSYLDTDLRTLISFLGIKFIQYH